MAQINTYTFTSGLSGSEHIKAIINSCAQTLYALRILRGMVWTMQLYRLSTVLLSPQSWSMLPVSGATDQQNINTFIRWSQRNRLVPPNLLPFAELCCAADDKLFQCVTTDRKHLLYDLIPLSSVASQNYNLHQRRHNLELPSKSGHLRDCNFIERMLFLDCYWRFNNKVLAHSQIF